jgi:hypothetical protein
MQPSALSTPTVRNIPVELADFARLGFTKQFSVVPGGRILCRACHSMADAAEYTVHDVRRVEGQSDPSDMAAVVAVQCRTCNAKGTLVVTVGPAADANDADVYAALPTMPNVMQR